MRKMLMLAVVVAATGAIGVGTRNGVSAAGDQPAAEPAKVPPRGDGADTGIVGARIVPAYKLIQLKPGFDTTDLAILWDIYPEAVVDIREIGGEFIAAAPPGVYAVKMRAITTKHQVRTYRDTVTVTGTGPVVPPVVPPVVDPVVPPVVPPVDPAKPKKLHVTIFRDGSGDAGDNMTVAAFLASTSFHKYLDDKGHKLYCTDIRGKRDDDYDKYIKQAGGVPALILQDEEGRVLTAIKLPKDETTCLEELKKVGG